MRGHLCSIGRRGPRGLEEQLRRPAGFLRTSRYWRMALIGPVSGSSFFVMSARAGIAGERPRQSIRQDVSL